MATINAEIIRKSELAVRSSSALGKVRAAYLFGSQTTGKAHEWSDIDIALFVDGSESWDFEQRTNALVKIMEECGDDVEAHFFPASEAENPEKGSFAEYIVKHGVKVH